MSIGKILLGSVAALVLAGVAVIEFPDEIQPYALKLLPDNLTNKLRELLPPPLPKAQPVKAAYWLDQNWRLEDRRWFHHASQGTATFPIPYAWFVALEQPYIWLVGQPGLLRDGDYLRRLGFIPSPKTNASPVELRAFGFGWSSAPDPAEIKPSTSIPWDPAPNDDGLPVGFARLTRATDPVTGEGQPDGIGLTCAACHTGHVEYKGVTLRIDGAGAMVDLNKLQSVLGLSLFYALNVPGRFDRFAERVLGAGATEADKSALKQQAQSKVDNLRALATKTGQITHDAGQISTAEGPGRLDALNRIGNQVFYVDLSDRARAAPDGNFHATNAPVSFPPIWTVPWFLWAQYDSSIEHPLIRNVGEGMGVAALVNLTGANTKDLYRSTIKLNNLLWIEDLLRGPDPFANASAIRGPAFSGLASPKWPEALFPGDPAWKIDAQKVARGRKLYVELCAGCHLGPIADAEFDKAFPERRFWESKHWISLPGRAEKILVPPQIPANEIGTDGTRAQVLVAREIVTPKSLNIVPQRDIAERWSCETTLPAFETGRMPFADALMVAVDDVIRKWMDENNISAADRATMFGALKNCPNLGPHQPYYRTRPLNGIWATAPYLHNGSAPSLYWLLRPAAERPKQFCVGASDFDPKTVGFAVPEGGRSDCAVGETLFTEKDADGKAIIGNASGGHSFENADPKQNSGVIGRGLSEDERYDLIEYLKTL